MLITKLPLGNYWKHLNSIILTHTLDEGALFIPNTLKTDQDFNKFLSDLIPPYAAARLKPQIIARYPPARPNNRGSIYSTEGERAKALFNDVVFLCNIRALTNAYSGKNFNLQYSIAPYFHTADGPANCDFPGFDVSLLNNGFLSVISAADFSAFSRVYQSYQVSLARSGDPNIFRESFGRFPAIRWPRPDNSGDALTGVLNATMRGFEVVTDEETRKSKCQFWQTIFREATDLGGTSFFFLFSFWL